MSRSATGDVWWKNAVVYCLDVETFLDGDGDGRGDLAGLCERIDYLAGIGVSCLWLMPFYPSVQRDDGYDITDFYGVDPRLGTHGDLVDMIRTARDRGIRVIADLVPNHTSDRHPWFQAAREGPENPYHDFYVWADEKPAEKPGDVVFPDQESSNWAYDRKARRWYLHRFYSHQPDLNVANPAVRDEIAQVAGFWLQQGLDGFRLDAVPFLIEPTGMPRGAIEDPHELLRDLRRAMGRRNGGSILLGEVNLAPRGAGASSSAHAAARSSTCCSRSPSTRRCTSRSRARTPARSRRRWPRSRRSRADCQWAHFVRNHDELTLDKLSEEERAGGVRRVRAGAGACSCTAAACAGGCRRCSAATSAGSGSCTRSMFSLPGTPVLFYGEEIGMAENPAIEGPLRGARADAVVGRAARRLHDRGGVRSGPLLADGPVRLPGGQRRRAAARPRLAAELDGAADPPPARVPRARLGRLGAAGAGRSGAVFAHRADWDGSTIVALHNLAGRATEARLALDGEGVLVDLFSADEHALEPELRLTLEPHGHRWFRVRRPGQRVAP